MAKSYYGSRYKDDFTVSRQDAESLYRRVASFLLLAKEMCNEKIELLDQEAALHAVLKNTEAVQIGITEQIEHRSHGKAHKETIEKQDRLS